MRETSIQCIARKFLVPRLAERFQSQINHVGLAQALIQSSLLPEWGSLSAELSPCQRPADLPEARSCRPELLLSCKTHKLAR